MKQIKYPATLQWEITPVCNENCVHCYNYWRKFDDPPIHPQTDYMRVASEIIKHKPVHVVITGGEPLSCFILIKEPIEMLRQNSIYVSINTNASLVTDEIADFMKKNQISAFVSLPSAVPDICDKITDRKGSFERIVSGIRILLKHHVHISTNMVITKLNIDTIEATALFVKNELGLDSFCAARASKPINSSETFDEIMLSKDEAMQMCNALLKIKKELGMEIHTTSSVPACMYNTQELFEEFAYTKACTAGKISYALDSEGNIKACPRDDEIYGNILTDDFSTVWTAMYRWRENEYLPEECQKCRVRVMCKGGCRIEAFPFTHSKNSMDPNACVENLPITFKKPRPVYHFKDNTIFYIHKNNVYVEEDFGIRVSYGPTFLYLSKDFATYLKQRDSFMINDILLLNGNDEVLCKKIIMSLVDAKLVYTKEVRV